MVRVHLHVPSWLPQLSQRALLSGLAGLALAGGSVWLAARRRRPTAEELERRRRERLAAMGRITDGTLVDARTLGNEESSAAEPEVLVYRYQLAGLVYECAQDCSGLGARTRGYCIGGPVQVRYDARNPGDSILVSESWSGLWLPRARQPQVGESSQGGR